jgi:hypothetical protein
MSVLTVDSDDDRAVLASGRGLLCVMDTTGDTRLMWDPSRPDEVATARAAFDAAKARGMVAYRVAESGERTPETIRDFDPTAAKIILAPALAGG